jgi:nucleolar GTP-binding protein
MSSLYVFKSIKTVHKANELIEIVLSKTQRKTPTEVHPGYQIQRIREFYMRKVKFSSETFTEKLKETLDGFPKLNDIHPFFADWLNVLYDKDHYKIALGQLNVVINIIDKIQKDYVKLIKFADSLYRCKTLKIAAMGRMCTAIKKLKPSLEYLEEVRKHISRLPSIDPFMPSVLLFGFPNVGKSSFINQITKANVEVSPMPFSTQNLFVGHTEFKNVKIQVIDSPGVLNRALENRNTIEMQSITALAHLKALIVFMMDISETCGYSIQEQINLFESLKPLFAKKPVVIALNKVDIVPFDTLPAETQALFADFHAKNDQVPILKLSALEEALVTETKDFICQELLNIRTSTKKDQGQLKTDEDYYVGVRVFNPTQSRNTLPRQVSIPDSVRKERESGTKQPRVTLKDLQEQYGGAGVFAFPLQEHFILENDEWKYDKVPEVIDGKNIWDYVDPDIERKLLELEREQDEFLGIEEEHIIDAQELEEVKALDQVKKTIPMLKMEAKIKRHVRVKKHVADLASIKRKLEEKGQNSQKVIERTKNNLTKRNAKVNQANANNGMEIEDDATTNDRSLSRRRSESRARERTVSQRAEWFKADNKNEIRRRKIQKSSLKHGESGDADRHVYVKKPKHLFAGKSSMGTRNKR